MDPQILDDLIRQRRLLSTFGNGGLPDTSSSDTPALTIAVKHSLANDNAPEQGQQDLTGNNEIQFPQNVNPGTNTMQFPQFSSGEEDKTPAMSAYKKELAEQPTEAPISKTRKVLGTIAGVLGGILKPGSLEERIKSGESVTGNIEHAPYRAIMQPYEQDLANKKALADLETSENTEGGKAAKEAALTKEALAHADVYNNEKNRYYPTTEEQEQSDKQAGLARELGTNHEAELPDGTKIEVHQDANGTLRKVNDKGGLGEIISRTAISDLSDAGKSLKETRQSRIPGNLGASIQAKQIIAEGIGGPNKYDQATVDAAKQFDAKLTEGKEPTAAYADVVQTRERELKRKLTSNEKIALDKVLQPEIKTQPVFAPDPNNPNQLRVIPVRPGGTVPSNAITESGMSQENVPTAATRGRGEQATTVIAAGEDLKKFIDQNKDKLGNIDNYWKNIVNDTPIADPTQSEFAGRLASYAALQAAAHGFRGANVMREFESKIGGAQKNPEAIKRAIDGITSTMTQIQKTGGKAPITPQATKRYNPATGQIEAIK